MVKGSIVDRTQLHEPLLPDASGSFSFQVSRSPPPRQHTLDLDSGNGDQLLEDPNHGEPVKRLENQASRYFRSLSGRFPFQNGYEGIAAGATGAGREKARRSQSKRRLRNPIQKKSFVKRAAHTAAHEPKSFIKNLIWGILLWPKWAWDAVRSQQTLTVLSLKAGIAAGLASIVCVTTLPEAYDELSGMAIWAVVTVDILAEANIGLSLSKGVNRVAGTLSAGALAVLLTQLGPDVPASIYPYFVVFWVTFGGFVFRFLKGVPPLKDQWGYAFTVATLTFHILLISDYQEPEKVTLPLMRFCMILVGFFLSAIVSLAFQPVYAGDTLHKLVAKNFDTAGDVLSKCVKEYSNSRMLDHVPDILCGRSEDDKIHQSYHEIVMSDSDIDKLLGAVTWEPCHGNFFRGYPWHLYDDITDYLRYTLYDVIALDSCLRASIQAPKFLRDIFSQEMKVIAEECANCLHTIADSMRNMRKFSAEDSLCRAEEAALALQNKMYTHTHLLLGRGAMGSPRYSLYVASSDAASDAWPVAGSNFTVDQDEDYFKIVQTNVLDNSSDQFGERRFSSEENDRSHSSHRDPSTPVPSPEQHALDQNENCGSRSVLDDNCTRGSKEMEPVLNSSHRQPGAGFSQRPPEDQQTLPSREIDNPASDGISVERHELDFADQNLRVQTEGSEFERAEGSDTHSSKPPGLPPAGWKQNFIQRRASLGHNWEGTLERISALSLVKFASLLIEVVAKMKFVVNSVEELSQAAKFQEIITPADTQPAGFRV